ncbi:hypothetical protein VTJ04DRAFT_9818 [Mycothermus thermophilus]|uniref:uncharacterized protein n=1 Tax=Humicola insolens TaxID=85995 RepID=UPI0037421FE7
MEYGYSNGSPHRGTNLTLLIRFKADRQPDRVSLDTRDIYLSRHDWILSTPWGLCLVGFSRFVLPLSKGIWARIVTQGYQTKLPVVSLYPG